jgi:hypothetical protein
MGEGVDMAQDSLSAGGSASACVSESEAHQHGVEPFCPPAGVKYKAAYGAEYLPPVAWLHITRLANSGNVPDPEPFPTCTTSLSMLTEYAFPGGTVYGPYSPIGTPSDIFPPQLVTVIPFVGVSAKIPRLDPGEQVTLAIPFKGAAPVLFPWTQQMYQPYQEVPNAYGDDFYDAIRDGTVRLTAYTVWPEYQALKAQYTGAANLSCAPPAELIVPPSP